MEKETLLSEYKKNKNRIRTLEQSFLISKNAIESLYKDNEDNYLLKAYGFMTSLKIKDLAPKLYGVILGEEFCEVTEDYLYDSYEEIAVVKNRFYLNSYCDLAFMRKYGEAYDRNNGKRQCHITDVVSRKTADEVLQKMKLAPQDSFTKVILDRMLLLGYAVNTNGIVVKYEERSDGEEYFSNIEEEYIFNLWGDARRQSEKFMQFLLKEIL